MTSTPVPPDPRPWVMGWAEHYDARLDEPIEWLHSRDSLDREGWEALVAWKFNRDGRRRVNASSTQRGVPDDVLVRVSGSAIGCKDDDYALRAMRVLAGVGTALGSAAPMTMDPDRFTR